MFEQNEDQGLFKTLVNRAQYLLAMREHGAKELSNKLIQKFPELEQRPGLVEKVVSYCQQQNWQSDARYIESYVRQAMEKGQGALKIRQGLSQASENGVLIAESLAFDDEVWIELARAVLEKKYGETTAPLEAKERARRLRFLQSRGFSASQCYKAFC
ncbi:regulatory protein RecX [Thiomicrospira microaerophila]|uniref:regulatory protein RecX n=1 Tax=Thiomicrospira microaerophila TaxID=406020 RepID=UPI00200E7782|nr:regulatory protein RecX [Thiomicrospira microaerophila]UQB41577.1 regulatory protein RecX [Thiomicrospira microaerophila]